MRKSPQAGDTAEGIARWWLGATPDEFAQVAQALLCLERAQLVQSWTARDGRQHYRVGPALLDGKRVP